MDANETSSDLNAMKAEIETERRALGERRHDVSKSLLVIDRRIQLLGERKNLLDRLDETSRELRELDASDAAQQTTITNETNEENN